jgi:hypothetical protein
VRLSEGHLHYGFQRTRRSWGQVASKRFPSALNIEAMERDGLLPKWAHFRDASE